MGKQSKSSNGKGKRSIAGEALVLIAVTLVAAAVGVGLVLHAGQSMMIAIGASLATFVGLLTAHKFFRRVQQAAALKEEIARLRDEVDRLNNTQGAVENGPTADLRARLTNPVTVNAPRATNQPFTQNSRQPGTPVPPAPPVGAIIHKAPEVSPVLNSAPDSRQGPFGLQDSKAPVELTDAAMPIPPAPPPFSPVPMEASPVGGSQSLSTPDSDTRSLMTDPVATAPSWQSSPDADGPHLYQPELPPYGDPTQSGSFEDHFAMPQQAPTKGNAASPVPPADAKPVSNIREVDVKKVHSLIKKLAQQVNAVEALSLGRGVPRSTVSSAPAAAQETDSPRESPVPNQEIPKRQKSALQPQLSATTAAVGASVSALGNVAEAMRTYEPDLNSGPDLAARDIERRPSLALGDAPISVADDVRPRRQAVLQVSEAISAGRMDIWLSPIHGLADRKAQHYEISVSLRDPMGETIDVSGLQDALRGTSLLPALDSARLVRTAQIGERLADRGHRGALFSNVTGEALDTDQFLNVFADGYQAREAFSRQLVIVFQQADVRGFGEQSWATLHDMQHLGFRFALSGVTDLDMDFAELKTSGFEFVKLTSQAFLAGLPALGSQIPAADVCQHLGQAGLTLVVDGIASETELAKIFGFGVLFGQGELFGGAREVRSKPAAVAKREAAA